MHAGFGAEGTAGREFGFAGVEGAFVQLGLEKIPIQRLEISKTEFVCSEFRMPSSNISFSLSAVSPHTLF